MRTLLLVCSLVGLICLGVASLAPVESAPLDASFTVTTEVDAVDGNPGDGFCSTTFQECSLRAAIQEANARFAALGGHYTITLPSLRMNGTTYPLTIVNPGLPEDNAASGDLDIRSNLTLRGTGFHPPIVDASAVSDRVFDVLQPSFAPIDVTLNYLYVQHGGPVADGGGIRQYGAVTLTLNALTVMSNTAAAAAGIYSFGSRLLLLNSTVRANSANSATSAPMVSRGGGVSVPSGNAVIRNSVIAGNAVHVSTSQTATVGGGGLYLGNGTHVMSNTQVLSNSILAQGSIAFASGGGLLVLYGDAAITNSTLQGNTADAVPGYMSDGGGLHSLNANVTLAGSSVVRNVTRWNGMTSGNGGGLYAKGGALVVERSLFGDNASGSGGGLYLLQQQSSIVSSTIRANDVNQSGGGLANDFGTLRVRASTLHDNVANQGAGIYNYGVLSLTNSTLSANIANYEGGGLYAGGTSRISSSSIVLNVAGASGSGDGGGIFIYFAAKATIGNSGVAYNDDLSTGGNVTNDCAGTLISLDYNLIRSVGGCTRTGATTHDIVNQIFNILALQDNGGPTWTHELIGGPAVNGGDPSGCKDEYGLVLTRDQRGFPRIGRCDIGAYELVSRQLLPLIRR